LDEILEQLLGRVSSPTHPGRKKATFPTPPTSPLSPCKSSEAKSWPEFRLKARDIWICDKFDDAKAIQIQRVQILNANLVLQNTLCQYCQYNLDRLICY